MEVKFLNLNRQFESIKSEVMERVEDVFNQSAFIQGKFVDCFSKNFLDVHGGKFGYGCSNGTSALSLALRTLGIGPGDEVITQSNTFIATVEAIQSVGATTVLVDCDPQTYSIKVKSLSRALTDKTKAIIPVHLYGNPAPMFEIMEFASANNLKVIEDCAQAHLAKIGGRAVGTFGDAGCFSFYPGKNLGAFGDAGFVIVNEEENLNRLKKFIDHGRISKYDNEFLASNERMDGVQGAILDIKLKYLSIWTEKRRALAERYDKFFDLKGIKRLQITDDSFAVYHLYVVEVENRQEVMDELKLAGIGCGVHYPKPVHMIKACEHLGYREGDFINSESSAKKLLSLPMCPMINNKESEYLFKCLQEVF